MKIDPKPLPVNFERKIDTAGRIVIPDDIRKQMNIVGGEMLIIKYTDKGILISVK
ncbi:MAG: hypothetical protein IJ462_02625 [Clostridia bacterium]|nr:hypothetical protein [Clostridia bacterium]